MSLGFMGNPVIPKDCFHDWNGIANYVLVKYTETKRLVTLFLHFQVIDEKLD